MSEPDTVGRMHASPNNVMSEVHNLDAFLPNIERVTDRIEDGGGAP